MARSLVEEVIRLGLIRMDEVAGRRFKQKLVTTFPAKLILGEVENGTWDGPAPLQDLGPCADARVHGSSMATPPLLTYIG